MDVVGSVWSCRVAAKRRGDDTPAVPGPLQSMSYHLLTLRCAMVYFLMPKLCISRTNTSWRSPCCLRESPCFIHSSCLLPNSKRGLIYREYLSLPFFQRTSHCSKPFLCIPTGWLRSWQRCPKRSWASTWKRWCSSSAVTTCQMRM